MHAYNVHLRMAAVPSKELSLEIAEAFEGMSPAYGCTNRGCFRPMPGVVEFVVEAEGGYSGDVAAEVVARLRSSGLPATMSIMHDRHSTHEFRRVQDPVA